MITAWVNGAIAQHRNTAEHDGLIKRPLRGWVGFQDHGALTQIKDVRLAPLSDGLGLKTWYGRRYTQALGRAADDPRRARPRPPAPRS